MLSYWISKSKLENRNYRWLRISAIRTSCNNIGNIQFNYFACRNFVLHITPPYINKAWPIALLLYTIYFLLSIAFEKNMSIFWKIFRQCFYTWFFYFTVLFPAGAFSSLSSFCDGCGVWQHSSQAHLWNRKGAPRSRAQMTSLRARFHWNCGRA